MKEEKGTIWEKGNVNKVKREVKENTAIRS